MGNTGKQIDTAADPELAVTITKVTLTHQTVSETISGETPETLPVRHHTCLSRRNPEVCDSFIRIDDFTMRYPGVTALRSCVAATALAAILTCGHAAEPTTEWPVRHQFDHFEIYSEFAPDIPRIRREIEDVQSEVTRLTGIRSGSEKTQIMLFSNHRAYVRYLGNDLPDARNRKAIFYRNGDVSQIYLFRSSDLFRDLRHELTHVVLHQRLPFIPLWIDEGLAEVIEASAEERSRDLRISSVRWRSRLGGIRSLTSLESIPSAGEMTADDYRDSWSWVFFLLHESSETQKILQTYIQAIESGEAPGSFRQFLLERDPTAEKRINSYFRKVRF
jgi:hypothetical protein